MSDGRRRGAAMVAALVITELISWGVLIYAFSVLLVPMRAELGWSDAQLSGAYAIGLLISGLAALPVGRWLDHHSPRVLMTAGSALTVAVLLGWSGVTSLVVFYALFVIAGWRWPRRSTSRRSRLSRCISHSAVHGRSWC